MFTNGQGGPKKPDPACPALDKYLFLVEVKHGQQRVSEWLGCCRQHLDRELPKVGRYIVALVAALGPDAAQAIHAAIIEGLRRFERANGKPQPRRLEPLSEDELARMVAMKQGGRPPTTY